MARYYGPCDVRFDEDVMRLHCLIRLGDALSGYVDDRYGVPLRMIAGREVTLWLPGGFGTTVLAGDLCARSGEPIGWEIYPPQPEPVDVTDFGWLPRRCLSYTEAEFRQLSLGEWRTA